MIDEKRKLPHDWYPKPLPDNVQIGEKSWLYSTFAFLHYSSRKACGVSIGHDSGLYNGTFFDLGEQGEVQVGNYCALVGPIFATNRKIIIEDYVFIAHEVVITDCEYFSPGCKSIGSNATRIRENAWIGAQVTIVGGVSIGIGAIIGAGSVITSDVPDYSIAAGNPSKIVGRITS